jgi:hypothetical protein
MGAYANPLSTTPGSTDTSTWSPFGNTGGGSSNQYFGAMPGMANPGQSTATSTSSTTSSNPYSAQPTYPVQSGSLGTPSSSNLGHGIIATGLQYPGLSSEWASYLQSQIGQSVGEQANPLMQQLMQFYQTGQGGGPGMQSLATIANQGVSALPEWQSMVAAMQPNIQQNQAQLQEQFAGMGDLAGSPFGTAMSNYMSQTALGENSLLAQLQQQNIGTQVGAAEYLQTGAQDMSQQAQQLANINLPQNNPMNQDLQQMSTMSPATTTTPTSAQSALAWLSSFI